MGLDRQDILGLKNKIKSFFKTKDSTEASIDILEKFIIPFASMFQSRKEVHEDEVIGEFFNIKNRHIHEVVTNRDFMMPGALVIAGRRVRRGIGDRRVLEGQKMLLIVDKIDNNAKVLYKQGSKEVEYLLERYEIETIKDWLNVVG